MSKPNRLVAAASPAKFFILLALADGPAHGADLIMQILSDSAITIMIAKSTIYDLLKELETEGFVVSRPPLRKTAPREYRITAEGRDVLRNALIMYENAVRLGKHRLR